jgi:hypothetical protein
VPSAWSLVERAGWLRLRALPAADLKEARNTLTQKLWDDAGVDDVQLDVRSTADGQRAGLTFLSGSAFAWIGVAQEAGVRRIRWEAAEGPVLRGKAVWLRASYQGDEARLGYSLDGRVYVDAGVSFTLKFGHWKGARIALFSYGPGGSADFDHFRYRYGERLEGLSPR